MTNRWCDSEVFFVGRGGVCFRVSASRVLQHIWTCGDTEDAVGCKKVSSIFSLLLNSPMSLSMKMGPSVGLVAQRGIM